MRPNRPTTLGILSTVLLLCGVLAGAADDASAQRRRNQALCRDRSGRLVVASSCGRGTTPVNSTDLVGPQGPQGSAGRGVNDALAGGTTIRGAGGGMFAAPGALADPWVVFTPFFAVLPTPLTEDKVIIAQRTLRPACSASDNIVAGASDKSNDCLRTTQPLNGFVKNQRTKPGQFTNTTDNICTGTVAEPTAPAGYLCIYLVDAKDFAQVYADTVPSGTGGEGFQLSWISNGQDVNGNTSKSRLNYVWAYTAP
jgi:hypothetical protein